MICSTKPAETPFGVAFGTGWIFGVIVEKGDSSWSDEEKGNKFRLERFGGE